MDYSLYDAFNQFVGQIQFGINSFLAIFAIIIAVLIAVGAYYVHNVAKQSAEDGIEALKEDIQFREGLTKRMDSLELSQENIRRHISLLNTRLYDLPLHNAHCRDCEQIYFSKNNDILQIHGTFLPIGPHDVIALLPEGYRPLRDTIVLAVADTAATILIKHTGEVLSNIPASEAPYTFQAYLPTK